MADRQTPPPPKATGPRQADQLAAYARDYGPALKRYFSRRGMAPELCDDLSQEVFVRLAGRAAATKIENPEAYLMQTAANVWRDFLRRRQVRAHADHVEFHDLTHGHEEVAPDRVYEGREKIYQVLEALNQLDERARQIFILCRIEGMKQREVAERLSISVSLVEKEMMKAIAHLTDWFGDDV